MELLLLQFQNPFGKLLQKIFTYLFFNMQWNFEFS